jgi:hypothetical protein
MALYPFFESNYFTLSKIWKRLFDPSTTETLIETENLSLLHKAFIWVDTPHGAHYWSEVRNKCIPFINAKPILRLMLVDYKLNPKPEYENGDKTTVVR